MPRQSKDPVQVKVAKEVKRSNNFNSSITRSKTLISEIEKITKRRTLTYFAASQDSPAALINDEDSIQIEDLLRLPNKYPGLDLILNSNGGYAISAERIINVCKTYIKRNDVDEFRVIVPRVAKSAATMVSLGADKILLCDNAELGPIDPQLILVDKNGKRFPKPGFLIYNAVKELLEKSNSIFGARNEKYLTFLRQYNYDIYSSASNELELSKSIAEKILNRKKDKYPDLTEEDFAIFVDPMKTYSHGRLIGVDDLKDTTLCDLGFIEDLTEHFSKEGSDRLADSKIEKLSSYIWELFIRKTMLLNDNGNPQVKVIEDVNSMLISGNPEWKPPTNQPVQPPQPAQP
jgi:hypothetical protein